jgi:hypothetical protein
MTAWRGLLPVLTLTMLGATVGASAFWTVPGIGSASATTATLSAATIATPASATNSIVVTFSQQASLAPGSSASSAIAYSVQRKPAGGSFAAIAGGGCAGSKAYAIASCADVPPATGSYVYRVVASLRSWTATSSEAGPVAFLLDTTAPTVQSIQRLDTTPTNAATVRWTVTFSESVTGVGSGDFALVRTGGVSGGSITGVTGSATTYAVTSSTGAGDGTLRLDLVDDDSITDVAANALGGAGAGNGSLAGEIYAIDRTAPSPVSLSLLDSNANGKVDRVTATFSEALATSTATAPWTLAGVPSGGTLTGVSTSGATATLTLAEGTGAIDTTVGAMTVALAASATGIRDATGNQSAFAASAPSDKSGPVPVVVTDDDGGILTNGELATGDKLQATFSEAILPATVTTPTTITEGGAPLLSNKLLTIGGFTNGALDMGSPLYTVLGTVTFAATAGLSNANKTLTITAGSCVSSCAIVRLGVLGGGMDYVPAPTSTDAAGNAATGSFHTTFPLF